MNIHEFKFRIGEKVKDRITGFEGIVVARADHITGCNTYGVAPPAKGGDFKESQFFDENRLETKGKTLTLDPKPKKEEKTGPGKNPTPTRIVKL